MERPFYKTVHRLLTMPEKDRAACRDPESGHTLALPFMDALIEWDKAHPVRYWLWRAYINLTTSPLSLWRIYVKRPILRFIQRGRRGWSVEDTWSFDTYLARVISEGLVKLKDGHSFPMDTTEEEWPEILDKIASGFAEYVDGKFEWHRDNPGYARFEESMTMFVQYFGNLWD